MKNDDMVRVTWHDAHAATETWTHSIDIESDPCIVVSIGFLLPQRKPHHVLIAQSLIVETAHVDHVIAIPVGMIKRIDRLKASTLLPIEPDC